MSHDAKRIHRNGMVLQPPLRLIAGASGDSPSPEALNVIAQLTHCGPRPSSDLAEVRGRYTASRRPLLAPLEAVESVVHVRPSSPDAPPLSVIRPAAYKTGDLLPGLLYLHGGGWTVGDFETYEPFCRQLASSPTRSAP